jgi:transcriptional regulator with GAF, ATPase, and Fis domain
LLLDRRLPDLDAEELLDIIRLKFPGTEVRLLDSAGGVTSAVADNAPLFRERPRLPQVPDPRGHDGGEAKPGSSANAAALPGMVGESRSMQPLYRMARLVAGRMTTVLIMGATGTGKELVARAIHQLSPRASQNFVIVNCAAIPEALLESELFGYVRGAFTGATQSQAGRIQSAEGGTLFLDEIGELPLSLQPKLLRFLDQKEVQRLGSTETLRANVRVIAATNVDLAELVRAGKFRKDLFYRLCAFPLHVPPLAQRLEDIRWLAQHFLNSGGPHDQHELSVEALQALQQHDWEGNVRELQQVLERAAILAEGSSIIEPQHLFFGATPASSQTRLPQDHTGFVKMRSGL